MNSGSSLELPRAGRRAAVLPWVGLIAVFVAASLPATVAAADLLQVYRDARGSDAQYAAARHALEAGREKLPQGRALVLPTLNLAANATNTRIDSESREVSVAPSFTRDTRAHGYTLTLTQPIYRKQNVLQYDQAAFQVRQAEASFGQAGQDLIVRVAQSYFDALAAHDTLELVRAQRAAISEQLAQAKQDLENARRSSVFSARQSYLAVINGMARVAALEQALISSQSALDSNKLGYEVGVRINIDVLNAQQQLFSTRRDLALARYNTVTSHLRLKAAAGALSEEDLDEVNRALTR